MSTPSRSHEVVTLLGGARAMSSLADGEVMHPGVGPLVEAEQLYVAQSQLAARLEKGAVRLFDIGLGAGSNALAARAVAKSSISNLLSIVSFERDLGALTLALDHPADFELDGEAGIAARQLLAEGRHRTAHCDWRLVTGELLPALAAESESADIVFWDPFSPRANPSFCGSVAAFTAIRRLARPGGKLITYSASTATRVALLLAGWTVGIGAPIGTKAHTTIAVAGGADLLAAPLTRAWLSRLSLPGAPLPSDAPGDAATVVARLPQFAF